MATASLAVNVARNGEDEDIEWVSLVAFGTLVQALLRHQKADLASVSGQFFRRRFVTGNGQEKIGWSLTLDSIVSARTVRPDGQRKTKPQQTERSGRSVTRRPAAPRASGPLPDDPVSDLWGAP
jgi:single-strand DNA-binding protein